MRKLAVLSLILVALAGATIGALPSSIMQDTVNTRYTTGIATISDGTGVGGVFRTSSFNDNPAETMRAAVHHASKLHFLRGTYTFTEPFISGRTGLKITADPGAVFVIDNEEAVSLFDLSGSHVCVDGLDIRIDTAVDDQIAIRISGSFNSGIQDNRFEVTATDGSAANPMILFQADNCLGAYAHGNWFLPNKGVRCLKSTGRATGLHVDGNYAGPEDLTGFAPGGTQPVYRLCDAFLEVTGNGWCSITDNRLWALGDPDDTGGQGADSLSFAMRFTRTTTSPFTENGHSLIHGNKIELVSAPYLLDFWGWSSSVVSSNVLGYNDLQGTEVGHAGIRITGPTGIDIGGVSGEAGASTGIYVTKNDIHNLSGDADGSHIYVDYASQCDIDGNNINVVSNNGSAIRTAGHLYDCTIRNNQLRAPAGNTSGALVLAGEVTTKLVVRGNKTYGFASSISDSLTLAAGAWRDIEGYGQRYASISANEAIGHLQDALVLNDAVTGSLKATLEAPANFAPGYVLPIYNDSAMNAISIRNPSDVELVSLAAGAATRVIRGWASNGTTAKWYLY